MLNKSQKTLSDIVVYTKYAKYLPKEKRRESWEEIVERYLTMMKKKYPKLKDEIEENSKFVYDKKILMSMRAAQFAGVAIEKNNSRVYNCAYTPIDHPRAFSEIMFLLLGGTGVGFSVQKKHIKDLPEIIAPKGEQKFLISDSIEGWSDAVKALMYSYYGKRKRKPKFDFSDIREKGARLVTAGGKAPGPEPLKKCLFNISTILERKQTGDNLTPLEVHDIVCHIADAVLAGGIRRAALISLFSADDDEMLNCKTGKWWELNPQRGRANNSVVLLRHRIKKDFFKKLWKRVELSKAGEPGFYFSNDANWGTNPCVEISLRPRQFCVTGNTNLITKEGICKIEDVVDKKISIWNGEDWSEVKPYQTGDNDRLHRVYLSDGSYLDATDNHKFLIKNRFEKEFREIELIDLIEELETSKYGIQIPRANIKYPENIGKNINDAYEYGFFIGDGHLSTNSQKPFANLYNEDKIINFKGRMVNNTYFNYNGTEYKTIEFNTLDLNLCKTMKQNIGLPNELFSWNKKSILNFIAGWADADGSQASKGIRIYGNYENLKDGQLLLTKTGINSSLNLMSKKGTKTNLTIRKNDVWYLQITKTIDIPCQRLDCNNSDDNKYKGKYQLIKKITELEGKHKSYCLTEEKLHQCVFNNMLTKQCNLTEINASIVKTQNDLNELSRIAAFFGTLQAGITDFHYLSNEWKQTTEKEALIGVGMTGICSGTVLPLDLTQSAHCAVEENKRIADIIGIKSSARVTTVKPSGSTSCVVGSSSGIHAWHSKYYIRNIQCAVNDDLYKFFTQHHPKLIKIMDQDPNSAVIGIPQKAPDTAILREDETSIEMLERVIRFNKEWVREGHIEGDNTNNVSATVYIKDDEWETVGEWLWKNKKDFNGISCLNYDGGNYADTPFQEIDEKTYLKKHRLTKNIDLTQIREDDDNTDLGGEVACSGGACDLTF